MTATDSRTDRLRVILSANLQKLRMHDSPNKAEPLSVRAWALSRGLDVRLITRLLNGDNAATLDKLDEIAETLGIPAWLLLYEDFDPKAPVVSPMTEGERALLKRLREIL